MPTSVNMEEIRQRISVINAQSSQINNTRSVNLGRKQTLESQLDNLIKTYNSKYGVQLTPETLEEEIVKVANEKEAECTKLSGVLEAINAQDYTRANQLLGISVEEPAKEVAQTVANAGQAVEQVSQPVAVEPVTPVQVQSEEIVKEAVEAQGAVVVESVAQPVVAEPVSQPVVPPVSQTVESPVVPPIVQPAQAVEESVVAPPMFNGGVSAPPTMGGVAPLTPPSGFGVPTQPQSNGLSGTEFMNGVQETSKAPMPALEGFTKGVGGLTGLGVPNLDVAPPTSPTTQQPKSFGDILGGNSFMNNN